jgi:hypothetical protein
MKLRDKPLIPSALYAAALLLAGSAHAQIVIGSGKNPAFPVLITQSGSYKLGGNLVVPTGVDGIAVADGVEATIDLNGFTISGGANCSNTGCNGAPPSVGIRVGNDASVRVRNGTVRGFARYGIGGDGKDNNRPEGRVSVENVTVTRNHSGIFVGVLSASRVVADNNAAYGILAYRGVITDSLAVSNGRTGICMDQGSVRGNFASHNGLYGFELWIPTLYEGNVSVQNAGGNFKQQGVVPGLNSGL